MDAENQNPTISEFIRSYPFRGILYAVTTFVVFQLVYRAIRSGGAERLAAENGPLEMAQVVLALIAALGLFCAARLSAHGRAGLIIAGALVAYAAARESDVLFETWLFDDAYKWIVGLPMVILGLLALVADRHRLLGDMMWWMGKPPATLFAVGGIFLCFVCQNIDRPGMWIEIGSSTDVEMIKALVEEYTELFAYLLLACSGIEAAILAYRQRMIGRQQQVDVDNQPAQTYRIAS